MSATVQQRRLGVGLWGGIPPADLVETVKAADRAGYEVAHVIESYADQYCFLAACARETTSIDLATGVTTVFNRNPTAIAIAGATVDALSQGRFRLGLGAGHREIVAVRDDVEPARPLPFERPLRRLRETVEAVRAIVAAAARNEPVSYEGEIFSIHEYLPWIAAYRDRFPIYFGAFFERSFELAGEIADGTIPIFMPLASVSPYVAAVRRGAERAGRDPAEVDVGCYLPCCVGELEQARTACRYLVAFHMSSYVYYRRHFEAQGQGETVRRMVERMDADDVDGAAALVSDEMVDSITIHGPPERCREGIDRYRAAGIALPVVYPIHPAFRGYLPDPAHGPGILHTIESLAEA